MIHRLIDGSGPARGARHLQPPNEGPVIRTYSDDLLGCVALAVVIVVLAMVAC